MMVHAVASILIGHPERGLKDLASPAIGNGYDLQLWKALAFARQGKWADAREKFKNAEFSIAALPLEMQRIVTADAMRAVARGEGLCRGLAAPQRTRSGRRAEGDETRDRGLARAVGRGARPRQGCTRRLQICRELVRPACGRRRQAARGPAAPQARRNRPGRGVARTRDTVRGLARRRDRGEDAGRDVADLRRHRTLQRIARRDQGRDTAAAEFRADPAEPGWRIRAVCAALSQLQRRGHEADRCARHVL